MLCTAQHALLFDRGTLASKKPSSDMASDIAALGYLAHRRDIVFASKKESLRKEIDMLRDFLIAVLKDRELLQVQVQAAHILCRKKLAKAESELHDLQSLLCETRDEAASLLECKQVEMERLQKERDEAKAQGQCLSAQCMYLKGYTEHLECRVCSLVSKLQQYHMQLWKKSEEVVETRGQVVDELEWVKQTMFKLEKNWLEFYDLNSQPSLEKEHYMNECETMKQADCAISSTIMPSRGLPGIELQQHYTTQSTQVLQERLQTLECNLVDANSTVKNLSLQLQEADITIAELHAKVCRLEEELQGARRKNLDYVKRKIEADAATQLREAAISVLRLRIFALEGDLQKERSTRTNSLPESISKTLTQFSPEVDLQSKKTQLATLNRDRDDNAEYSEAKLEAAKSKLQADAGTVGKLREINANLGTNLDRERSHPTVHDFGSNAWGMKKMRKLEQTLAEAYERYTSLRKESGHDEQFQEASTLCVKGRDEIHGSKSALQASSWEHDFGNSEHGPEQTLEIMNQFLGNKDVQSYNGDSWDVDDLEI